MEPTNVSPSVELPTTPGNGAGAVTAAADKAAADKAGPKSAPFGPNAPLKPAVANTVDTVPGRQQGDTGNEAGTV